MNSSLPIGIFDSGIGGLTVTAEILKLLPNENLIYLGDTARVPYGTRDNETIKKFSKELTLFLLKQKVKAIVVACNTMSAVSLSEIKEVAGKIPVIDVISPTVEFAVTKTRTSVLGVIGTRATTHSGAYQAQVRSLGSQFIVVSKACPLFVPLVEEGLVSGKSVEIIAENYLKDINEGNADVLILGCTHYPMLAPVIKKVSRRRIKIIDSAFPTAEKLKKVLAENKLLNLKNKKPKLIFYVTDNPERSLQIANLFFDGKFPGKIEKVKI
jgi:glutamate racemase